jgi:hypothetical protein
VSPPPSGGCQCTANYCWRCPCGNCCC